MSFLSRKRSLLYCCSFLPDGLDNCKGSHCLLYVRSFQQVGWCGVFLKTVFSTDLWLSVSLVDWKKERWFYFLNAKTVNISLSRMKNVCEEQTFSLEVRMLPMSEHLGFIPCCGS